MDLTTQRASLDAHLRSLGRLLVAYSGGVDSAFLAFAAHEALGGEPGTRPLVVDPFAGGGSIPLEALRVGADTFASDLNPVAVLLNKVVLEYIPRWGKAKVQMLNAEGKPVEFDGLADSVRRPWLWGRSAAQPYTLARQAS